MVFNEQEIGTLPNGDISTCCHGIDINCCPAGCADYIDDHDSPIDDEGYKESLFIHNEINRLRKKIIKSNSISPIQWCSLKLLVVTPIDLLMVKFTFYKRSNNLIVHLFAFRKTNGFSY
ncbi:hypothetical protein PDPUS_3_00028 (plasmid) [Photobacterium damselae subsp. piscicida]|uniref:Uncharacterized protein n=1 Tax=Photobacterium damsela subsp. piscicida TaxID=38294 RepID=A0A1V1VIF2_PHODP|nr:hypothetical protein [Photobacterium damselae]MDP2534192.1 hypothetical protein [Photobacterium damselae subsp. piscicida]MDP2570384.1 hypothetical protein [Photobacterium damselae subsp. piscicida]QOD55264.1 hypothetical protein IC628_22915 [Photobacterium damselae subsp. piscicida]QOD59089.1 hypothetical protein IC627_23025 [Photobacterium damselae subsp. piscicida]BAX56109.1 hypothetical protein PDPUS_3_00028 [Photobacterium damselae subsp. piscicida]